MKVTLFITGKTFLEEFTDVKKILEFENLEIAGHTFDAFKPTLINKISKIAKHTPKLRYIYKRYQEYEIERTVRVIKEKTGIKILSWRTHAFAYDIETPEILEKYRIKVWSDFIELNRYKPYKFNNLFILPLNLGEDHSSMYHGFISPQYAKKYLARKLFYPHEYFKFIREQTLRVVENGGIATINLHPACMYLVDKFRMFKRLCKFFSQFESICAKDVINLFK